GSNLTPCCGFIWPSPARSRATSPLHSYENNNLQPNQRKPMSKIRVLVGTKKGAFILTSDGKRKEWKVSGPHFAGWEIYHVKGSPADPDRIYVSQTSGWFGQIIQRSDDAGKTWTPVGNKFVYEGVA